jgi:tetratricopeptide (TPR) repeat protein
MLLRRLSVFAGGWTLEAAEAVGAGEGINDDEVLELLTTLVEKSLVQYEERGGEARYRLLETVRQYSRDRLLESREMPVVCNQHASFYLTFAEQAEPELRRSDQVGWLNRLDLEHDNLRAALEWSLAAGNNVEVGLRLAGALWWFWLVRSHFTEGGNWLDAAVSRGVDAPAPDQAKVLNGAAYLARVQGQLQRAKTLGGQALTLSEELVDKRSAALALYTLGYVADAEDDRKQAADHCEKSLTLWRELGDTWGIAYSLEQLGSVAAGRGEFERAEALGKESHALFRELGDRRSIATSLWLLAWIAVRRGDHRLARTYFEQILPIFRDLKDKRNMAWVLSWFGRVAGYEGNYLRAARLLGAAKVLCEAHSVSWLRGEKEDVALQVAATRTALGEQAFAAAWEEGRAITLEQAVAFALEESHEG